MSHLFHICVFYAIYLDYPMPYPSLDIISITGLPFICLVYLLTIHYILFIIYLLCMAHIIFHILIIVFIYYTLTGLHTNKGFFSYPWDNNIFHNYEFIVCFSGQPILSWIESGTLGKGLSCMCTTDLVWPYWRQNTLLLYHTNFHPATIGIWIHR